MTNKQKKSPASNVDVSEQKQSDAQEALVGLSSGGARIVDSAAEGSSRLLEYLRIGECLLKSREKVVADYLAANGDTPQNHKHACDAAHLYLEDKFGRSRASARLLIRCYQRFVECPDLLYAPTLKEWFGRPSASPRAS